MKKYKTGIITPPHLCCPLSVPKFLCQLVCVGCLALLAFSKSSKVCQLTMSGGRDMNTLYFQMKHCGSGHGDEDGSGDNAVPDMPDSGITASIEYEDIESPPKSTPLGVSGKIMSLPSLHCSLLSRLEVAYSSMEYLLGMWVCTSELLRTILLVCLCDHCCQEKVRTLGWSLVFEVDFRCGLPGVFTT